MLKPFVASDATKLVLCVDPFRVVHGGLLRWQSVWCKQLCCLALLDRADRGSKAAVIASQEQAFLPEKSVPMLQSKSQHLRE